MSAEKYNGILVFFTARLNLHFMQYPYIKPMIVFFRYCTSPILLKFCKHIKDTIRVIIAEFRFDTLKNKEIISLVKRYIAPITLHIWKNGIYCTWGA